MRAISRWKFGSSLIICIEPQVGADNFIRFDDEIIKEVGNIVSQGHASKESR